MRTWSRVVRAQFGFYRFRQPDQHNIAAWVRFLEIDRGRNRHARAMIAPHAIDGYRGVHVVISGSQTGLLPDKRATARSRRAKCAYSPLALTIFFPR
jgi:hypothetical protein